MREQYLFLILARVRQSRMHITQDVSAGGGGGSDGSEGEDASSAAIAGVPSPADLAANAAPVYLDEVPQCAGLNAKQCEDLLFGK